MSEVSALVDWMLKAAGQRLADDAERMVRAYKSTHRGLTAPALADMRKQLQRELDEQDRERQAEWDRHEADRERGDVAMRRAHQRRQDELGIPAPAVAASAMAWARPRRVRIW